MREKRRVTAWLGLRVRQAPTVRSAMMTRLPWRTEVVVDGGAHPTADGYTWGGLWTATVCRRPWAVRKSPTY